MQWQFTLYAVPSLTAALIAAIFAFYVWRHRDGGGRKPFVALMLAILVWSAVNVVEIGTYTPAIKIFLANLEHIAIVLIPPLWLLLAVEYAGYGRLLTRYHHLALMVEPVVFLALLWTNEQHFLIRQSVQVDYSGSFPVLDVVSGPLFWAHIVYSYAVAVAGWLVFFQVFARASHIYRRQAGVMLLGALTPWVANVLFLADVVVFDPSPLAFSFVGVLAAWGLFRLRLFDIAPAARDVVVETMRDPVIVIDNSGRVVDLNAAAQRVLGYTFAEAIGQPAAKVLDQPRLSDFYQDVTEVRSEICLEQNGKVCRYQIRLTPLQQDGRLAGQLVILHDITERKRAEAEREKLIQELDAFAHTVAHDIKNPLALVIGFAELLNEGLDTLPESQLREVATSILKNSRKIDSITDEMLLLSGLRGSGRVVLAPLDMAAIVEETLQRLSYVVQEAEAEITRPEAWPAALGYAPWVEEVWANYISNAVKYGGDAPRVELGGERLPDGMVRFWVRDSGLGLSPEEQDRLFAPHVRLDRVSAKGHGLGLSIVRRIVERLDGHVDVESEPGAGSVFSFTLPAAER